MTKRNSMLSVGEAAGLNRQATLMNPTQQMSDLEMTLNSSARRRSKTVKNEKPPTPVEEPFDPKSINPCLAVPVLNLNRNIKAMPGVCYSGRGAMDQGMSYEQSMELKAAE